MTAAPRRAPPVDEKCPGAPAHGWAAAPCPFCGGVVFPRWPWRDHLPVLYIRVRSSTLRLAAGREGRAHLGCHGCEMSFVPADADMAAILPGLRVRRNAAICARHYYGDGVSVRDLLARHRTAVVKRVRWRPPLLSSKAARSELVVCLKYNGMRTFCTLRLRGGDGSYEARELEMA